MAWTHYIKSRTDTLDLLDVTGREADAVVAIDRSIYVIGYEMAKGELQVHIFHVDTFTWNIVRFTDLKSDSSPWDMDRFFTVAHGDDILIYSENYSMEPSLFVLNTKTMRWNRLCTDGQIPENGCGGCLLHRDMYVLKKGNVHFELWALDLGIMRWRFVSEIELDDSYWPIRFFSYENRIYMHMEVQHDESTNISIVYYDTVNKKWEWLDAPGHVEFSQPAWASFLYSKHFYYVSGICDQRDIVFRYSLERNEWERIRIEGVPSLYTNSIGNVVVLDNKAFFLEFWKAGVHVLDLEPSLKTRCLAAVSKYKLDTNCLPVTLQTELSTFRHSD